MNVVDVGDLLPQAEPMVLLSGYEPTESDDTVTAIVDVTADSPFFERAIDGVPSCVALEYMAQTMALLVGLTRRKRNLKPQIGFVLGSRKLELLQESFGNGQRYRVTATCTYQDEEFGSFDCQIVDANGLPAARGVITAFQAKGEMTPERLKEYA